MARKFERAGRFDVIQAPRRKLLAALTAAALMAMAGAPQAGAAQAAIPLLFAPLGDQAHPDQLSFNIPLAAGESVADIRYLPNGNETSLLNAFSLQVSGDGVTATFLPKLDFRQYLGQTLTLKVVKTTTGAFAAQSEELLLLKVVAAQELQADLKLVAVTDGTVQPDRAEFLVPGALNASLSDLLLVSATENTSLKPLFTLSTDRGGNTLATLRSLDLDHSAGQTLELRATKLLNGSATPLTQKLLLSPLTAATFTADEAVTLATSGDEQPDPFTLELGGGANVDVQDIILDQADGTRSVLGQLDLARASDGTLSAKLKSDLDWDALTDKTIVLRVQLAVAGQSYTRKITLSAKPLDRPSEVKAPALVAKDDASLSIANGIGDPDGVRNVLYILYADAAGQSEVARNDSGAFANLTGNSTYYAGVTAETLDRITKKWAAQKSSLLAVTTDQAMPAAFAFNPVSNASVYGGYTSNRISVDGLRGKAAISVSGGEYAIDGGAWTSVAGTVSNGQSVQVRCTTANSYSTASKVTLTIGGRSGDYVLTTVAAPVYDPPPADTTPNAFTFVDQTNVALSTQTESAAITVAGIDAAASISVAGGEYQINGGAWTAAAGSVTNGQTVKVRHTSSGSNSTATNTTLTIGGVSDTFTTTTVAAADAGTTAGGPALESKTTTAINTAPGAFTDADGVRNVVVEVWNAARDTKIGEAANGDFAGLTAGTTYSFRTKGEAMNGTSGAWEVKTSAWVDIATGAVPAAPAIPDLQAASDSGTSNSDNITNVTTPTFDVPQVAGATGYKASVDGGAYADIGNVATYQTGVLGGGNHTIAFKAYNAYGDGVASPTLNFTIDIADPTTTAVPDVAAGTYSADQSVTFSCPGAEPGCVMRYATGVAPADPTAASPAIAGALNITGAAGASTSTTVKILLFDAAGNPKGSVDSFAYTIDKLAPVLSGSTSTKWVVGGAGGPAAIILGTGSSYVDTLTYGENVTLGASSCTDPGMNMVVTQLSPTQIEVSLTRNSNGFGVCQVNTTDAANNASTHSVQTDF